MKNQETEIRLVLFWLEQYPAKARLLAQLKRQGGEKPTPGIRRRIRELEEWLGVLDRALATLTEEETEVVRQLWLTDRARPGLVAAGQKLYLDRTTVARRKDSALHKLGEALFGRE